MLFSLTGSSKGKNLYKSPIDKGSPSKKYLADELENKFESLVQNAKSSISKHKTDKKLASESDVTASKNKFDQGSKTELKLYFHTCYVLLLPSYACPFLTIRSDGRLNKVAL